MEMAILFLTHLRGIHLLSRPLILHRSSRSGGTFWNDNQAASGRCRARFGLPFAEYADEPVVCEAAGMNLNPDRQPAARRHHRDDGGRGADDHRRAKVAAYEP